jgi:hypothetical protein
MRTQIPGPADNRGRAASIRTLKQPRDHACEPRRARQGLLLERDDEATWKRIGALLGEFSPKECANYFANSGYASV